MNLDLYINRLLKEWMEHGKIIIACDYDDTLRNWSLDDDETRAKVIELLKIAKTTGAYIVIFTACSPDRYDEIKTFCAEQGIIIDSINKNPIDLPYGNDKKVYANIFLDDRAGLLQAMEILKGAMYQYRSYIARGGSKEQIQ